MWKSISRFLTALSFYGASLALPFAAMPAAASDTSSYAEITSLPCTITVPGNYCLRKNLSTSYSYRAIFISASNVTLDLNGYTLQGTGTATASGVGVCTDSGTKMVNVQNGTIAGFSSGVMYAGVTVGAIQSLTVQDCSTHGIFAQERG